VETQPEVYPDKDSLQMVFLGPAYDEVTMTLSQIDKVIHALMKMEEAQFQLIQPKYAVYAFDNYELEIRSEGPVSGEVDVFTTETILALRILIKIRIALDFMANARKKTKQYGHFVGATTYNAQRIHRGTTQKEWFDAALHFDEDPIGGNL